MLTLLLTAPAMSPIAPRSTSRAAAKNLDCLIETEARAVARRFAYGSISGVFDQSDAFVVAALAMHNAAARCVDPVFLRTCGRNAIKNEIKRLVPRGDMAYPQSLSAPADEGGLSQEISDGGDAIGDRLTSEEIDALLEAVTPATHAKLLRLVLIDGLSQTDCVPLMGVTSRAAISQMYGRALQTLRAVAAARDFAGAGKAAGRTKASGRRRAA